MKSIETYIITNGDGAEAVDFYQKALGATLKSKATFGEGWPECPEEYKDLIMNAQFDLEGIRFQLSDNNPMYEYKEGNQLSAALICETVEEATRIFNALSKDAKEVLMELQEVPWSPAYGNVVDRFGVQWQVNVEV